MLKEVFYDMRYYIGGQRLRGTILGRFSSNRLGGEALVDGKDDSQVANVAWKVSDSVCF